MDLRLEDFAELECLGLLAFVAAFQLDGEECIFLEVVEALAIEEPKAYLVVEFSLAQLQADPLGLGPVDE